MEVKSKIFDLIYKSSRFGKSNGEMSPHNLIMGI